MTGWRTIVREVAARHGMTERDMLDTSIKRRPLSHARFEACWRIRHELRMSYPLIGHYLRMDHSSVINAVTRWPEVRDEVSHRLAAKRGAVEASDRAADMYQRGTAISDIANHLRVSVAVARRLLSEAGIDVPDRREQGQQHMHAMWEADDENDRRRAIWNRARMAARAAREAMAS